MGCLQYANTISRTGAIMPFPNLPSAVSRSCNGCGFASPPKHSTTTKLTDKRTDAETEACTYRQPHPLALTHSHTPLTHARAHPHPPTHIHGSNAQVRARTPTHTLTHVRPPAQTHSCNHPHSQQLAPTHHHHPPPATQPSPPTTSSPPTQPTITTPITTRPLTTTRSFVATQPPTQQPLLPPYEPSQRPHPTLSLRRGQVSSWRRRTSLRILLVCPDLL